MVKTTKEHITGSSRLINIFSALGDKTRFKLVKILRKQDQICVSELASEIGISTAGTSQHLQILEKAGVVKRNRSGQKICYTIDTADENTKQLLDIAFKKK